MNEEINTNKVKNDINDLKGKKMQLLRSLQNDIDEINMCLKNEYCTVGEKTYELFLEKNPSHSSLYEDFETISQKKNEREEKLSKKEEIAARYDEEIILLEKLLPESTIVPLLAESPVNASLSFCQHCGTKFNPATDKFCMICGSEL